MSAREESLMKPGIAPITCPQGSTFRRTMTYKIGRKPVDLTEWDARMQVRESHDADSTLANLTTDNGGLTLGGSAGTIVIYISHQDTANIRAGHYVYDLELVEPNGDVMRLVEGKFTVTPETTR